MPDLTAFAGYATHKGRQELYVLGGYHTDNSSPGPTKYVYTDKILKYDIVAV